MPKDKSSKRVAKREKELLVLELFQDQGKKLSEATKKHVMKGLFANKGTGRPPPYIAQMPLRQLTIVGDYVFRSEKDGLYPVKKLAKAIKFKDPE